MIECPRLMSDAELADILLRSSTRCAVPRWGLWLLTRRPPRPQSAPAEKIQ
jgi:hypothetical protein